MSRAATTRRKIIAGIAVAPVMAIPSLPAAAAASTAVETLLAAEARLSELDAIIDARWKEADRSSALVRRELGKFCPPWRYHATEARRLYYKQRGLDRYNARKDKLLAERGYPAAIAELKAAEAERNSLENELWRVPATDPASLIAKARIAKKHTHIMHSVVDDMLAYFGGAA